jgi:hypothetical protein
MGPADRRLRIPDVRRLPWGGKTEAQSENRLGFAAEDNRRYRPSGVSRQKLLGDAGQGSRCP